MSPKQASVRTERLFVENALYSRSSSQDILCAVLCRPRAPSVRPSSATPAVKLQHFPPRLRQGNIHNTHAFKILQILQHSSIHAPYSFSQVKSQGKNKTFKNFIVTHYIAPYFHYMNHEPTVPRKKHLIAYRKVGQESNLGHYKNPSCI